MHPSQQKPNTPPPPCKSVISLGEWIDVSKTFIGNERALVAGSTIVCSISGAPIRIVHSGQKAWLGSLFKMDSPAMKMYSEEKVPGEKASEASPILLVTSVTGKATALPGENVKYEVTGYNLPNAGDKDRKRIKWVVLIDGAKEYRNEQGETLDLLIKKEWAGKEIIVMPYLNEETEDVSVLTVVQKKIAVLFIGGAADKNEFFKIEPTNLIKKGVMKFFLSWIKDMKFIISNTLYLGFDEVFRDEHISKLCITIGSTDTPVYIIGHSLGGWNGAHLSQILTDKGYNVEMLITLDPVGEGAMVWAVSELHYELPSPKAKYWINISASPDDSDISDLIADIGERWIPEKGPNINYITKANHARVDQMFNETIYQGKSAFLLLKECIIGKQ